MDHCRGCQNIQKKNAGQHNSHPLDHEARNAHINADGFGIGWYSQNPFTHQNLLTPTLFRSITPAHTNENLHCLAEHTYTTMMFAHLRAASSMNVSESNCHPFIYGKLMFMHNGAVARFLSVVRFLQPHLSNNVCLNFNNAFQCIKGTTDSEFLFAIFLDNLDSSGGGIDSSRGSGNSTFLSDSPQARQSLLDSREDSPLSLTSLEAKKQSIIDNFTLEDIERALVSTIHIILGAVLFVEKKFNLPEHKRSSLNIAVTDGVNVVCSRFRDKGEDAPSLYYTKVKSLNIEYGDLNLEVADGDSIPESIIVASEPLSYEEEKWKLIDNNVLVSIVDNTVIMSPIMDEDDLCISKFQQFCDRDPLGRYYKERI